jgi:hypothetical protein
MRLAADDPEDAPRQVVNLKSLIFKDIFNQIYYKLALFWGCLGPFGAQNASFNASLSGNTRPSQRVPRGTPTIVAFRCSLGERASAC